MKCARCDRDGDLRMKCARCDRDEDLRMKCARCDRDEDMSYVTEMEICQKFGDKNNCAESRNYFDYGFVAQFGLNNAGSCSMI